MASLFRPVGPLPPGVYWRRRALLLGVPLLSVGLIAWACSAGGSPGGPAAAPAAAPTPTRTPVATITAPPMPSGLPSGGPGPTYGGGLGGATAPGSATTTPGGAGVLSGAPSDASGGTGTLGNSPGSTVRSCTVADVTVGVVPTRPTFIRPDMPSFQVSVVNHSATACAVWWPDVVVTTTSGTRVYGSQDCVATRGRWVLPAGAEQFQTVPWGLQRSTPGCAATALGTMADPAGTYTETVSVFPGGPAVGGSTFTVR